MKSERAKLYEHVNSNRKVVNEEIYQEIAEEYNIPYHIVKEVVNSQSLFTAMVVKIGAFESVMFPYLGKVKAKLSQVQRSANAIRTKKTNEDQAI